MPLGLNERMMFTQTKVLTELQRTRKWFISSRLINKSQLITIRVPSSAIKVSIVYDQFSLQRLVGVDQGSYSEKSFDKRLKNKQIRFQLSVVKQFRSQS